MRPLVRCPAFEDSPALFLALFDYPLKLGKSVCQIIQSRLLYLPPLPVGLASVRAVKRVSLLYDFKFANQGLSFLTAAQSKVHHHLYFVMLTGGKRPKLV